MCGGLQGLRSLLGRMDEALALSAAQKGSTSGSLSPVRRGSSMARSSVVDAAGLRKQSVALQAGVSRRASSMVEAAAARRHSSMAEPAIPEDGAPDAVTSRRSSKVAQACHAPPCMCQSLPCREESWMKSCKLRQAWTMWHLPRQGHGRNRTIQIFWNV